MIMFGSISNVVIITSLSHSFHAFLLLYSLFIGQSVDLHYSLTVIFGNSLQLIVPMCSTSINPCVTLSFSTSIWDSAPPSSGKLAYSWHILSRLCFFSKNITHTYAAQFYNYFLIVYLTPLCSPKNNPYLHHLFPSWHSTQRNQCCFSIIIEDSTLLHSFLIFFHH